MKKTFYGRTSLINGFLALSILSLIAFGCVCNDLENVDTEEPTAIEEPEVKEDFAADKVPSKEYLNQLVKNTIMDFHQSLKKDDYSHLYKNLSKEFKKSTTPEKLKQRFKPDFGGGINLAAIKNHKAGFFKEPKIERTSNGQSKLRLHGSYETSPDVRFTFEYVFEDRQWKLSRLEALFTLSF